MKKPFVFILNIIGIIISAYVYALAVNLLYVPNNIISGGITGAAMLISHLINFPIGYIILILNAPIFVLGYKQLGKSFVFLSMIFVVFSSIFINITANMHSEVRDLLLASIYGGLVTGVTIGITFRLGGSSAGVDVIAAILNRKFSFSIGEVILAINVFIIIASAFIYRIDYALYTLIAMYVSSKALDIAQVGLKGRKTIFIISDKSDEIVALVLEELHRGCTYLSGEGAFTKQSKKIIMCVITRIEISQLKDIVYGLDPNAFLTITDTKEVVGKGFSTTLR
jgi:uncharacterized membrane-anchored protein YitT (DUF2179 family)